MILLKSFIIAVLLLFIIIAAFYISSNCYKKAAGFSLLLLICAVVALCFLIINKKNVINLADKEIKVVNISYYCPNCSNYISSINTHYCSRCGRNLKEIIKQLNNF